MQHVFINFARRSKCTYIHKHEYTVVTAFTGEQRWANQITFDLNDDLNAYCSTDELVIGTPAQWAMCTGEK